MTVHLIMLTGGLASLVAGLLRLPAARRSSSLGPRAMCAGLLFFGASFLVIAPAHAVFLSELVRVPNAGRLLGNLLTLAAAGSMQVMMLHLAHPPPVARRRLRRRLALLALVAALMIVLMLTAETENIQNFVERYATYTPITVYQLAYLSCLALAVADLINLSVRYSRHVPPMLRAVLRTVAAGGVVLALHTAYKIALLGASWSGRRLPGDESFISSGLAALGGALIAAATTLPLWGPRVAHPWRVLRRYRSYRRLTPLWRALSTAVPGITLAAADRRGWTMDIRLYRRVIEIRDAQVLLQPRSEPAEVAAARAAARRDGLTGDRAQAFADAAALASALRHRHTDHPATEPPPFPPGSSLPAAPPLSAAPSLPAATPLSAGPSGEVGQVGEGGEAGMGSGDASLAREIRYLELVAAAFARLTADPVPPTHPAQRTEPEPHRARAEPHRARAEPHRAQAEPHRAGPPPGVA